MSDHDTTPLDEDATPIHLRVAVDSDGYLCLYDALTGRPVKWMQWVQIEPVAQFGHEDLQTVQVSVITDPRVAGWTASDAATDEARAAIERGDGEGTWV